MSYVKQDTLQRETFGDLIASAFGAELLRVQVDPRLANHDLLQSGADQIYSEFDRREKSYTKIEQDVSLGRILKSINRDFLDPESITGLLEYNLGMLDLREKLEYLDGRSVDRPLGTYFVSSINGILLMQTNENREFIQEMLKGYTQELVERERMYLQTP